MTSARTRHKKRPRDAQWPLDFGSATWTRTRDPMINSHLLYRLSYRGSVSASYGFLSRSQDSLDELKNLNYGIRYIVQIVAIERRRTNTPCADDVNPKLGTQALHLLGC